MSDPTGGAAFPQPIHHPDLDVYASSGMSLRDYFAAKAIAGLSANSGVNVFDFVELASMAYAQADAMLDARVKP